MKKQDGAVMVEATIYFPIVLLTVLALLYLGLFKLQEAVIVYDVQKVATQSAFLIANPGNNKLGNYMTKNPDMTSLPSQEQVKAYYEAFHSQTTVLYREIGGPSSYLSGGGSSFAITNDLLEKTLQQTSFLVGFTPSVKSCTYNRGLLGSTVDVKVAYRSVPIRVLTFFELPDSIVIEQSATADVRYPGDFVRTIDLGGDLIRGIAKIFGVDNALDKFIENFGKVRDWIF